MNKLCKNRNKGFGGLEIAEFQFTTIQLAWFFNIRKSKGKIFHITTFSSHLLIGEKIVTFEYYDSTTLSWCVLTSWQNIDFLKKFFLKLFCPLTQAGMRTLFLATYNTTTFMWLMCWTFPFSVVLLRYIFCV